MLTATNFSVDPSLFREACNCLPKSDMKTTINKPTGDFFYDPWVIKDEYKGTVWETLYDSLLDNKGEARIIILDPAHCYQIHADIDDRYHLNILGEECFLIDLVREQLHRLEQDGVWYSMDAGMLHTASNFGRRARVQLVVRKLLKRNILNNPVAVTLTTAIKDPNDARFVFDNTISPWLNESNKLGFINEFCHSSTGVKFNVEQDRLESLKNLLTDEFSIS